MKNLKVTMHLDTSAPVILNRLTTIDNILLSAYYGYKAKKGERLPFDPEHKTVDFIHKEKGVFSGSIWYIDRDENIYHDFNKITKKPEYRKMFDETKKKKRTDAYFKALLFHEETMIVKKIHFYIRGKMEHIETLLQSEVSSIGLKQRLGFGEVKHIEVEEVEQDKGYMLNETTPSKPLPVIDFEVLSKKIINFKRSAPYWGISGLEACYVPTSSLFERKDQTANIGSFKLAKNFEYISNVNFIYENAKKIEKEDFQPFVMKTVPKKKERFEYTISQEPKMCVFSGEMGTEGVHGDVEAFMRKWKTAFGDVGFMQRGDFISKQSLWCLENFKKIGYSLVSEGDKEWKYLQGAKKEKGSTINDYIVNHKKFNPPFSINLKDTDKQQHVSFKGRVSLSTAFYYAQYGNKTLQIDAELLIQAIKDIEIIGKKYPNISKTHLCGHFKKGATHIPLKKGSTEAEEAEVMDFHRKYNSDLRNYMNIVSF